MDGIHIAIDNSVDRSVSLNNSVQALRGPRFVMREEIDDFTRIAILRMVLTQNYAMENDPSMRNGMR